jgi:hypothetical protein
MLEARARWPRMMLCGGMGWWLVRLDWYVYGGLGGVLDLDFVAVLYSVGYDMLWW